MTTIDDNCEICEATSRSLAHQLYHYQKSHKRDVRLDFRDSLSGLMRRRLNPSLAESSFVPQIKVCIVKPLTEPQKNNKKYIFVIAISVLILILIFFQYIDIYK